MCKVSMSCWSDSWKVCFYFPFPIHTFEQNSKRWILTVLFVQGFCGGWGRAKDAWGGWLDRYLLFLMCYVNFRCFVCADSWFWWMLFQAIKNARERDRRSLLRAVSVWGWFFSCVKLCICLFDKDATDRQKSLQRKELPVWW